MILAKFCHRSKVTEHSTANIHRLSFAILDFPLTMNWWCVIKPRQDSQGQWVRIVFRDRNISLIHEPNLFSGVSEKQTKVQDVFVLRADPFNDSSTNTYMKQPVDPYLPTNLTAQSNLALLVYLELRF